MARIVLINAGIQKVGVNNIGDFSDVFPDEHPLTSTIFEKFDVLDVPCMSVEEVKQIAYSKKPELKRIWNYPVQGYSDVPVEQEEAWNDKGSWRKLNEAYGERPNVAALLPTDIEILKDPKTPKATAAALLLEKLTYVFITDIQNQEEITIVTK